MFFAQQCFIFGFYEVCAFCGFAHIGKSELLERGTQCTKAAAVEISGIGRRYACDYLAPIVNQGTDACNIVDVVLRVLRAHHRAVSAQNAIPLHHHRAVVLYFNGLYGANANALTTILAVNAFKLQDPHAALLKISLIWVKRNG